MTRFLQEFFWTPDKLIAWIRTVCSTLGLWLVVWLVDQDARLVHPNDLRPEMFKGLAEDSLHLFLGRSDHPPKWRKATGSKRLLDFQRSLAVQLVPSVIAPDQKTLLQGRLAILRPDQYQELQTEELVPLFKRLRAAMKQDSDARYCVVQRLPNGERKIWKNMLVGKSIPSSDIKLKQFVNGQVIFEIDKCA